MKEKPWVKDKSWFARYAEMVARLKLPGHVPDKASEKVEESVRAAFTRVYRAVAFDIDGTLTEPGKAELNLSMAEAVGRLIQRSIPVFLITGRGRSSTRKAAEAIREHSGLSDWYFRRLQCITHNGVYLMSTPTDNPKAFLSSEKAITSTITDLDQLYTDVYRIIAESRFTTHPTITREPQSLRVICGTHHDRSILERLLAKYVSQKKRNTHRTNIYLCRGAYANLSCLDLSATNKKIALNYIAKIIGVNPDKILRIGDQGQTGGNDYDLLDSSAGFSVGELSSELTRCFPVLSSDLTEMLTGADATNQLIDIALLFPPLSLAPTNLEDRLKQHSNFERLATIRSRDEAKIVTDRVRVRLKYIIQDVTGLSSPSNIETSDILDRMCGGVMFRDWELNTLPRPHPLRDLFRIPHLTHRAAQPPASSWCMFTDTGILMRGPNYYFGLTQSRSDDLIEKYMQVSDDFVTGALDCLSNLVNEPADFMRYKFALAMQDNIRNILINMASLAFIAENMDSGSMGSYTLTKAIYREGLYKHTDEHYDLLLDPDSDWVVALSSYKNLLQLLRSLIKNTGMLISEKIVQMGGVMKLFEHMDKGGTRSKPQTATKLFRWRECDNFLQNVTAVQIGLHQFRQRPEIRMMKRLVGVGVAFGGIELPAIGRTVAKSRGFNLDTGLVRVSIYSDKENSKKVRQGGSDYVADLLSKTKPICAIDESGSYTEPEESGFILMDDNCTTGITLQLTRDFMVVQGYDVVGAVVVRFPGLSRYLQMGMDGHGFPDPEALFSFIRGLVAPSPYARLLLYRPRANNPYLDQTGTFDKAKGRIIRYLYKNGTPAI